VSNLLILYRFFQKKSNVCENLKKLSENEQIYGEYKLKKQRQVMLKIKTIFVDGTITTIGSNISKLYSIIIETDKDFLNQKEQEDSL
jgi:aspartate-semialdehyde dehydrogenase